MEGTRSEFPIKELVYWRKGKENNKALFAENVCVYYCSVHTCMVSSSPAFILLLALTWTLAVALSVPPPLEAAIAAASSPPLSPPILSSDAAPLLFS